MPRSQQRRPGPHPAVDRCSVNCLDTMGDMFNNRMLRKLSFYFLLLFLAALTSVDVFKLIKGYWKENTDTDMTIEFNETITMPNLTFCMSKGHAWSFFKPTALLNDTEIDEVVQTNLANLPDKHTFLERHWDYQMVIDAYQVIASLNSLERETSSIGVLNSIHRVTKDPRLGAFRSSLKKWLDEIQKRNVTFEEFQDKVGRETLKRSLQRFQRLSTNSEGRQIRNGIKITWISQMQLCFQPLFDKDNFAPIQEQASKAFNSSSHIHSFPKCNAIPMKDQFFTLSMAYNSENVKEVDCMSVDIHGRPSSEARFLEGKGRAKDGFYDDLCIGRQYEIDVEVRSIYTSLPNAEEQEKKCRVYEQGDQSEFECRSRCRIEWIRKVGQCTPLTISYLVDPEELERFPLCNYANVSIDRQLFNLTNWDKTCSAKCYPDCTQTRYHLTSVQRTAPIKEVTQVTLLWGTFEYLRLSQKEKWSFAKFFSNLGGSVGMWLGLSVLSAIQFITYLLTRIHKKVAVKRKISADISTNEDGRTSRRASDVSSSASAENANVSNNPSGGATLRH